MKKLFVTLPAIMMVLGMAACSIKATNGIKQQDTSQTTALISSDTSQVMETSVTTTLSDSKYGDLQGLIEAKGLPIYLRMLEGIEQTIIELSDESAKREWMSNNDYRVYENLTWKMNNENLIIRGEWTEDFVVDIHKWSAVSVSDGKEYSIMLFDKENSVFYLPSEF